MNFGNGGEALLFVSFQQLEKLPIWMFLLLFMSHVVKIGKLFKVMVWVKHFLKQTSHSK